MAILFDNKYHKIVRNIANYENDTTEIEMQVYANQETREREKMYQSQVNAFLKRVQQFLIDNMNNLINETNKIQRIETIIDRENFLLMHPQIKIMADEVSKIQDEGLFLIDNLFKQDINISTLNFETKWRELGLSEDLCKGIKIIGTMGISVDGIISNDLSMLYSAAKEKIVSEVVDC